MKVVARAGRDDLAVVYIAETEDGRLVEFSEALQPPLPRDKKWVIMLSTLYGCPARCPMCDAGGEYRGKLSFDDIFFQIDFLVDKRYPDRVINTDKFKIQFARMGEPALNKNVLDVLQQLPDRYRAWGLLPCLSTVAPKSSNTFFERLIEIKKALFPGNFQLQFSLHTTDSNLRDTLIPIPKWDFRQIAAYGERFYDDCGRKITLNFALVEDAPVDTDMMRRYFDPDIFLVKATPVNPTFSAADNKLSSYIDPYRNDDNYEIIGNLRRAGYEVIFSIGEPDENLIGSNCGQYVTAYRKGSDQLPDGYKYRLEEYPQVMDRAGIAREMP